MLPDISKYKTLKDPVSKSRYRTMKIHELLNSQDRSKWDGVTNKIGVSVFKEIKDLLSEMKETQGRLIIVTAFYDCVSKGKLDDLDISAISEFISDKYYTAKQIRYAWQSINSIH